MNQETFVAERKPIWDQLYSIVRRLESQGLKMIEEPDLESFGFLYRRTATDLSYARARNFDSHLIEFLNGLVAHAHAYVYAPPPAVWKSVVEFYMREFPQLIRRRFAFVVAAMLLFYGSGLLAYSFVITNPYTARSFVGEEWISAVEKSILLKRWVYAEPPDAAASAESAQIMTNNIKVSFAAFALGITYGIGTAWLLVREGFRIGGIVGLVDHHGISLPVWGFLAPHGVLELSAICIAGAAGLLIGFSMVYPGDYSRIDSLRLAGPEAVKMIMGTIPLFIVAGTIEAFFSPLPIEPLGKIAFSVLVAAGLALYLLL